MGEEFYYKITNDEYWELSKKSINIDWVEFSLMSKKIKSECDKLDEIDSNACDFKRSKSDDRIKMSVSASIRNLNHHANVIIIFKIPDEYYVLRLVTHETLSGLSNGKGITDFKCDQFDGLIKCIENAFTLLYYNSHENEEKIINKLSHIKLFEAYSEEDYRKAFFKIKDLIKKNKPNDEILSLVNKYTSDDAEEIDKLRLILNRVEKTYSIYTNYIFFNKRTVKTIKRRSTGKVENIDKQDDKKYYTFRDENKILLESFLKSQKSIYEKVIDSIDPDIDTTMIEFIFNKLFELLDWINKTGIQKGKILANRYAEFMDNLDTHKDVADSKAISDIEKLNDLDFENEVEELKKLIKIGKIEIIKCINSI